jgi:hypothetical protein
MQFLLQIAACAEFVGRFHRAMTRPFFTKDRISHFDLFNKHCDTVIALMNDRLREGFSVDFQVSSNLVPVIIVVTTPSIQDLMFKFTLDSATEFLFGSCVNSLGAGLPYPYGTGMKPSTSDKTVKAVQFAQAFLKSQEQISERERLGPIWPLFEVFKDKTKEHMKVVNEYLEPIIQDALRRKKEMKDAGEKLEDGNAEIGDDETLLDHLVEMTTGEAPSINVMLLRIILFQILPFCEMRRKSRHSI